MTMCKNYFLGMLFVATSAKSGENVRCACTILVTNAKVGWDVSVGMQGGWGDDRGLF